MDVPEHPIPPLDRDRMLLFIADYVDTWLSPLDFVMFEYARLITTQQLKPLVEPAVDWVRVPDLLGKPRAGEFTVVEHGERSTLHAVTGDWRIGVESLHALGDGKVGLDSPEHDVPGFWYAPEDHFAAAGITPAQVHAHGPHGMYEAAEMVVTALSIGRRELRIRVHAKPAGG